jgi:hypothetical protein
VLIVSSIGQVRDGVSQPGTCKSAHALGNVGGRVLRSPSDHAMNIERTPSQASLIDVLDRVLDKGIVVDAWVRLSVVAIDLIILEARIVVVSMKTSLGHCTRIGDASGDPASVWLA